MPGSLLETDGGNTYNTAIAVSPEGEIVARYRKLFPWRPFETTTPGGSFVTFDIPDRGRVGLAICFDGSFPEVARQLAWLGAEVIIQPTLTTTRDREMEIVMSRANAFANQVYVVNVNGADPSAVGESVIVDPEGTIMQHARGGEEILYGVLDLDRVTQVRRYGTHGINRPWAQLHDQQGILPSPCTAERIPTPGVEHSGPGSITRETIQRLKVLTPSHKAAPLQQGVRTSGPLRSTHPLIPSTVVG